MAALHLAAAWLKVLHRQVPGIAGSRTPPRRASDNSCSRAQQAPGRAAPATLRGFRAGSTCAPPCSNASKYGPRTPAVASSPDPNPRPPADPVPLLQAISTTTHRPLKSLACAHRRPKHSLRPGLQGSQQGGHQLSEVPSHSQPGMAVNRCAWVHVDGHDGVGVHSHHVLRVTR